MDITPLHHLLMDSWTLLMEEAVIAKYIYNGPFTSALYTKENALSRWVSYTISTLVAVCYVGLTVSGFVGFTQ